MELETKRSLLSNWLLKNGVVSWKEPFPHYDLSWPQKPWICQNQPRDWTLVKPAEHCSSLSWTLRSHITQSPKTPTLTLFPPVSSTSHILSEEYILPRSCLTDALPSGIRKEISTQCPVGETGRKVSQAFLNQAYISVVCPQDQAPSVLLEDHPHRPNCRGEKVPMVWSSSLTPSTHLETVYWFYLLLHVTHKFVDCSIFIFPSAA